MKWLDQSSPLPAQVSRHAISICATIGTGIFILTLPNSLREAGPAGVLLAYIFTSTVVYATCISNAEMMSYMPDAGGLVGLADIFVDPALGFAIGWSSWYNWAILIPDYLGIAANLITSYVFPETPTRESTTLVNVIGAFLLVMVVFMNCLRAERVGSVHSVFALVKLATLAVLIVSALFIALIPVPLCNTSSPPHNCNTPGSKETLTNIHIGGSYWRRPGPFAQIQFGLFYKPGNGGRIAGVFNVLIQSLFSFNGTETLSIVGRELINPATNTRISVRRMWLRVTIIYILAAVAIGLVVPSDHEDLQKVSFIRGSPWTIAFATATRNPIPRYIIVALFSLSALGAASANIWLASRWLFFLALRGHAPLIFRSLYTLEPPSSSSEELEIEMIDIRPMEILPPIIIPPTPPPTSTTWSEHSASPIFSTACTDWQADYDGLQPLLLPIDRLPSETEYFRLHVRSGSYLSTTTSLHSETTAALSLPLPTYNKYPNAVIPDPDTEMGPKPTSSGSVVSTTTETAAAGAARTAPRTASCQSQHPKVAIPWVGVLSGGVIGLVFFMVPAAETNGRVDSAFRFLTSLSNCTSLIGWIGMLITYLRFYTWTIHQEKRVPNFKEHNWETIYKNRARGQPWVAVYGLVLCTVLFLGQGWSVFLLPDANQFAQMSSKDRLPASSQLGAFGWKFCSAYLPVGLALMMYLGYKLTYQTECVDLQKDVPYAAPQEHSHEPLPRTSWEKLCHTFL